MPTEPKSTSPEEARKGPQGPNARSLIAETRHLLKKAGLSARKGLGQHFLVDGAVIKYIIAAAELGPADTVVEVGPGLGTLTRALIQHSGKVIAIEKDPNLARLLREELPEADRLTIVNADVLETVPAEVMAPTGNRKYKVVANLPYYITSPVLRHFLEAGLKPQRLVVMVQKEVARQMTAAPGEMSLLSVAVQLYGRASIVRYVPARAFHPAPAVDSAILKVDVYPKPLVDVDVPGFFRVVKAGFSSARKQIANPLSQGLGIPKPDAVATLVRSGIDPSRRAETLSIEEWGRLWQEYDAGRDSAAPAQNGGGGEPA
jgi:16S rRNA (adenine1518-N6/adenine1519-N6)-dimethyltransferase